MEAFTSDGYRAHYNNDLQEAVIDDNFKLVRRLLKKGGAIDVSGETPLTAALEQTPINTQIVSELIKHGGDVNYYLTSLM